MTKKYILKLGAPILALSLVAACGNADDPDPIEDDAPVEDPVEEEVPMDGDGPIGNEDNLLEEEEGPLNELEDQAPDEGGNVDDGGMDPNLNNEEENQ